MDKWVKEALAQYQDKIDNAKSHPLDLSNYFVDKPWGNETWLVLNKYYAFKLIKMKQGCRSSLQLHKKKIEANYVISGDVEVLLENEKGEMESRRYKAGEGWVVPLKTKHRVIAITDYVALEVSTAHLNDCVRFQDDNNRPSGKIETEHKK